MVRIAAARQAMGHLLVGSGLVLLGAVVAGQLTAAATALLALVLTLRRCWQEAEIHDDLLPLLGPGRPGAGRALALAARPRADILAGGALLCGLLAVGAGTHLAPTAGLPLAVAFLLAGLGQADRLDLVRAALAAGRPPPHDLIAGRSRLGQWLLNRPRGD